MHKPKKRDTLFATNPDLFIAGAKVEVYSEIVGTWIKGKVISQIGAYGATMLQVSTETFIPIGSDMIRIDGSSNAQDPPLSAKEESDEDSDDEEEEDEEEEDQEFDEPWPEGAWEEHIESYEDEEKEEAIEERDEPIAKKEEPDAMELLKAQLENVLSPIFLL